MQEDVHHEVGDRDNEDSSGAGLWLATLNVGIDRRQYSPSPLHETGTSSMLIRMPFNGQQVDFLTATAHQSSIEWPRFDCNA